MSQKKFSPMRFTAATEEAAVEGALQLVGAARDEISYDFISQTAKGVTIRIRPFDPDEDAPAAEKQEELEAEAPLHIDSMDDFDDSDNEELDETDDESDDDDAGDDELDFDASLELEDDEYDVEDEEEGDAEDSDEEELEDDAEPEFEVDAAAMERALDLARALLEKMGLDAQVRQGRAVSPEFLPLSIEGEDVGILIGKHGATLQSFQYVMNLTLNNGDEEHPRVSVDAGNYRARRRESLEAVARGTAARVRRESRPIKMEPMPSNERRIVHDFLKTEAGVSTQSEGREPHRCVVIAPASSDYVGAGEAPSRGNRGPRGMGGYGRGRGGRNRR